MVGNFLHRPSYPDRARLFNMSLTPDPEHILGRPCQGHRLSEPWGIQFGRQSTSHVAWQSSNDKLGPVNLEAAVRKDIDITQRIEGLSEEYP
jgi:hypothetical protein